jgi:alpha-amylase/alpha-mannosidase (GH57 family)
VIRRLVWADEAGQEWIFENEKDEFDVDRRGNDVEDI